MFKLGELCPEAHDRVPDGTNDEDGKSAIKQSSRHSSNHENKHSRSSEMGSDIPSFYCICSLFLERCHRILSLSNVAGTKIRHREVVHRLLPLPACGFFRHF